MAEEQHVRTIMLLVKIQTAEKELEKELEKVMPRREKNHEMLRIAMKKKAMACQNAPPLSRHRQAARAPALLRARSTPENKVRL